MQPQRFKKLIYISNGRIPTEKAHGYQISKMCESFASHNILVELWVPRRANTNPEDLFAAYSLKKNFSIKTIWVFDFLKKGGSFQPFFYFIQTFVFLTKLFFKWFPKDSIAYTRNPEVAFVLSLKGVEVVYEDHGWPKKKISLYLFLLKQVKKVVAITKGIQSLYEKNSDKKVYVAPDAVDLDAFKHTKDVQSIRTHFNFPQNKKIAMYTGSFYFYSWKGVDVLLDAAQYLFSDIAIVLIGANKSELEKLRAQYNHPNILIIERQPRDIIPSLLKSADLLILPNKKGDVISELYTSPLKLFEYMAANVPIVASKLPSIEEILNDGNSYLVEPNDSKELAKGINKAFSEASVAQAKAQKAYNDVQYHTWEKRAERILDFIA